MSKIEQLYIEALNQMTGQEKFDRTCHLYAAMHEMLSLQITRECGEMSELALRKKVAERMYMGDPAALKLLERVEVE